MGDFNSSLPVRTQNNGDVVTEICDGTTSTQKLGVNSAGSAQVAGQGVAGTPAGGVVSVQGVSGGTAIPISGTVTASNPSVSTTGTAVPTSATFVGGQATTAAPTYVSGDLEPFSLNLAGALRTDGSGVTQPVSGTVTAAQGTAASLAAAWPVEITDGTNVLGTALHPVKIDPTGTTTQPVSGTVAISGTVASNLTQVGGTAIALGQTTMSASLPVAIASNQTALPSNITQVAGSAVGVSNPLGVQISTGAAYVSLSNPLPVTIDPGAAGTFKNYYTTTSAVASGASTTQSTTVGGVTGFYAQQVIVSGEGKFKAVVQIGGTTFWVAFNSTANPTVVIPIPNNTLVATAAVIQVVITNNDLAASDLYSTISGFQV